MGHVDGKKHFEESGKALPVVTTSVFVARYMISPTLSELLLLEAGVCDR